MVWAWLLPVLLLANRANAGCTLHDFKWRKNMSPAVTQPLANDPTKVLVNWAPAIQKNARCADEWTVIMYPNTTGKVNATKIVNKDKDARSMLVDVQACVIYRFSVEYLEKETFDDIGETAEAIFKTNGICPITQNSNSPNRKKKMKKNKKLKKKIKKGIQTRRPGSIIKRGNKTSATRKTFKKLNFHRTQRAKNKFIK